jgi:hypothetical protein
MTFDWQAFLSHNAIAYSTAGGNVARGHIVIHCPFCGSEDESQHMEIHLQGRGWRCFRRPREHKGRDPTKLVQALLRCSWGVAASITKQSIHVDQDFMETVNRLVHPPGKPMAKKLSLPNEFLPFGTGLPSSKLAYRYLENRGYSKKQIDRLTYNFGIRYCSRGPYDGRIVFPVYHERKLVTWTGRTVYPSVTLRYKTLSTDPEKADLEGLPPAIGAITEFLLWYDDLKKSFSRTICLVEGPFDALRVAILGHAYGIDATCFFTMQPSVSQLNLLHEILPKYKRRYLLLDQGTLPTALRVVGQLDSLGVLVKQVPSGVKDPADMDLKTLLDVLS